MSIIVGNDTKLVVSGLTGREGSFHGLRNRDYGTDLVAGVTPGKGGQDVEGFGDRQLAWAGAADAERIAGKRSVEIEAILGYRGRDEMIHRDDLVLTGL